MNLFISWINLFPSPGYIVSSSTWHNSGLDLQRASQLWSQVTIHTKWSISRQQHDSMIVANMIFYQYYTAACASAVWCKVWKRRDAGAITAPQLPRYVWSKNWQSPRTYIVLQRSSLTLRLYVYAHAHARARAHSGSYQLSVSRHGLNRYFYLPKFYLI